MSRTLVSLVAAAAVTSTFSVPPATATPAPTADSTDHRAAARAGADLVRAWNGTAMDTLAVALTPVPEQPLYLAYVHRAVYDAARSAARRRDANVRAAVTSAAFTVLVRHFPSQRTELEAARAASLESVRPGPGRRHGTAIGRAAARREITSRADDGRNGPTVPIPPPAPGVWSPVVPDTLALSSWLGSVRPFVLRSPSQLRPPPPPALGSRRWAAAYAEVRAWGGTTSTRRSPAQTANAQFWSDSPYVQNQEGLRAYSERRGMRVLRTARLFALADTAAADGAIACWDAKMLYEFWRPVMAVPAGDTDGNPATTAEPGWTPLVPVTPNHPEYPSAHSCVTTAMMTVVAGVTRGRLDIDLASTTTGTTRHFRTVRQLVGEVGDARVFGGLHWRFSTDAGQVIGRAVARQVLSSR